VTLNIHSRKSIQRRFRPSSVTPSDNINAIDNDGLLFCPGELQAVDYNSRRSRVFKFVLVSFVVTTVIAAISFAATGISQQQAASINTNTPQTSSFTPNLDGTLSSPSNNSADTAASLAAQKKAAAAEAQAAQQAITNGNTAISQMQARNNTAMTNAQNDASSIQQAQQAATNSQQQAQQTIANNQAAAQQLAQCQANKSAAAAPLGTQIDNLQSQISSELQQVTQNVQYGTYDKQLAANIAYQQGQLQILQNQRIAILNQYQC
jgi:chromosome segregation ATPase